MLVIPACISFPYCFHADLFRSFYVINRVIADKAAVFCFVMQGRKCVLKDKKMHAAS
jgi:hypothetical protein